MAFPINPVLAKTVVFYYETSAPQWKFSKLSDVAYFILFSHKGLTAPQLAAQAAAGHALTPGRAIFPFVCEVRPAICPGINPDHKRVLRRSKTYG